MKKLLVALVALSSLTAFAHEGDHKHMIRFTDFNGSNGFDSFNLDFSKTDGDSNTEDSETSSNNFNINYAYAINNMWQVGGTYRNETTTSGDAVTIGLSGYYNLDKKLVDTCYVGLHYDVMTASNDDKTTSIGVEYGHRFSVGEWMGLHLTYSPSINITQSTKVLDNDSAATYEDEVSTSLAWNFVKFDVLF